MMSKSIRSYWLLLVVLLCALGVQAQTQPADNGGGEAPPAGEPTASLGPPVRATASVLRLIRFSGSLNDPSTALGTSQLGQPAAAGVVGVTFALYADQEGGAPLWLETQNVSLNAQGHYTVLLGATESEGLPLEIFTSGEARWLGIQVQGQPEQARILLVAVPYALKAAEAETLSGKKLSEFVLSEQLSEQVQKEIETQVQERAESGEIPAAEGEISPEAVTETGRSTFTDTNSTEVVFVEQSGTGYGLRATAPSNSGLRGETTDTTGTPAGVEGVAAANRGRGVYGHTTNASGKNIGVLGESSSVEGTGVFGSALSATGNTTGVRGDAESTTGVGVFGFARALTGTPVGVRGQTFSQDGIGVEGVASPAGGFAVGVKGESVSNRGRGIYGLASNSAGIVFGVLGETPSTKGRGVYGVATSATGGTVGVRGDTFSQDGTGVTGFARHATGGVAVYGLAIGSSAIAGQFENSGGGQILSGVTSGKTEVFSVDGSGNVTATSFSGDGSGLTNLPGAVGNVWTLTGNAGTTAGTNFLGTTDNVALELHVNSTRVLRLEPHVTSPNIIGGFSGNSVAGGVAGGTIGGGGETGATNQVTDQFGTVSGGKNNQAGNGGLGGDTGPIDATFSTVGGGFVNVASGAEATVAGGRENTASGGDSSIGGGLNNTASGGASTISGGSSNLASEQRATVGGGENNTASSLDATVGGGSDNTASGQYASIGGGRLNESSGNDSTIGGGRSNLADAAGATVGGGFGNSVTADKGTVAGGGRTDSLDSATGNFVTDQFGTVGGGGDNQAGDGDGNMINAWFATVAGGQSNTASGQFATVSGGQGNTASSTNAVVAGGVDNTASSSNAAVGGGMNNAATQPLATVPGGRDNTASALLTFAAGRRAKAMHQGAFVWADTTDADFPSERSDQFRVRAGGGARFDVTGDDFVDIRDDSTNLINTSTGAVLTIGGAWTDASDAALKENFAPVDPEAILARLVAMPVQSWNYKAESPDVHRLGPTAQDFYTAFGLGTDDKHISGVDAHGVAFAALQALYRASQEQEKRLRELEAENEHLKEELAERVGSLEAELAALKAELEEQNGVELAVAKPE